MIDYGVQFSQLAQKNKKQLYRDLVLFACSVENEC